MKIGIVGLPNVGKSTLFNALLKRQAALAANYPFATIEPNIGMVDVPDPRIERLVEIVKKDFGGREGDRAVPEKVIPATVKFYDIAGLVKGAAQGEGLGNAFLGHIREVDAIVHVVRDFDDENVIRAGSVAPADDIATINTELMLADLNVIDKRLIKLDQDAKSNKTPELLQTKETLQKIKAGFDVGKTSTQLNLSQEELDLVSDLNLLALKPVIFVYNIDEKDLSKYGAQNPNINYSDKIFISAKVEAEIAAISDELERAEFLNSLGIAESGLDRVIRTGYHILGLQTFFTMGPKEVHAWTIQQGSKAPQAAGKIHTDFERGFISAQVIAYKDLDLCGSEKVAKDKGLVRLEGKNYVMQDGDVVEFNFSV
jgi:ribosome-binding ATPase